MEVTTQLKGHIKDVLVEMAINGQLDGDMNQLDIDAVFDKAEEKGKFKILIVPSSDDEGYFEELETFAEAKKLADDEPNLLASIFEFDTLEELDAFKEGYEAGIGYMGEGMSFVSDNVTTARCERNMARAKQD